MVYIYKQITFFLEAFCQSTHRVTWNSSSRHVSSSQLHQMCWRWWGGQAAMTCLPEHLPLAAGKLEYIFVSLPPQDLHAHRSCLHWIIHHPVSLCLCKDIYRWERVRISPLALLHILGPGSQASCPYATTPAPGDSP